MSLRIHVDAYSGYKANEGPLSFYLDEEAYDIDSIEDRWHDSDAEYFKVRTTAPRCSCCGMTNRKTSGDCKVASIAMNC